MLELSDDGARRRPVAHAHAIQVQEFRRPEFEVAAQASPGPHFVGGEALVTVRAAYFAGGVLPDAPVTWNVRSTPGQFTPPGRDDFTFGDVGAVVAAVGRRAPRRARRPSSRRTDAAGQHHLKIEFERVDPPQASQVEAEASVMDVNRQAWTSTARLLVHPADVYVGLPIAAALRAAGRAPRSWSRSWSTSTDARCPAGPVIVTLERMAWEQVAGEWKEVPASTARSAR